MRDLYTHRSSGRFLEGGQLWGLLTGYEGIGRRDALVSRTHRQLGPLEVSLGLFAEPGECQDFLVSLGLQVNGMTEALFHVEAGLIVDLDRVAVPVR